MEGQSTYRHDTVCYLDQEPHLLQQYIAVADPDSLLIVGDQNTQQLCLPVLQEQYLKGIEPPGYFMPAGEDHKSLQTLEAFYHYLLERRLSRNALIIILGGGVVTDLFGYAAATYLRGVPHLFVPTTLLAMVDASVGGKRAVNFMGHKNRIGCIEQQSTVFISTAFLKTLSREHWLCGWAEMLKHAILEGGPHLSALLSVEDPQEMSLTQFSNLIRLSVELKAAYVEADLQDKGKRHCLNLGHTFGHALEAWALQHEARVLPHGYAVAAGLLMALYHARHKGVLEDKDGRLRRVEEQIKRLYPPLQLQKSQLEQLWSLMQYDKKNRSGAVSVVLPLGEGRVCADAKISRAEAEAAFSSYLAAYNK